MGLMGMGGAAGAGDAIADIFHQRLQAAQLAQQDALTRLKYRELAQTHADTIQNRQDMLAERAQNHAQMDAERRQANFQHLLSLIPQGSDIAPADQATFAQYGASTLLTPKPISAPSAPDSLAAPDQPQTPQPLPGSITNSPQTGLRPMIFGGTAPQQYNQDKLESARQVAEARAAEAAAREDARRSSQDALTAYRNSNLDLRERNLQRLGDQFDTRHPQDDPTHPRGVQDYELQLRQHYGDDLPAAESELATAWPEIRRAHSHADATKVVSGLRGMFAAPVGASKTEALLRSLSSGTGATTTPGVPLTSIHQGPSAGGPQPLPFSVYPTGRGGPSGLQHTDAFQPVGGRGGAPAAATGITAGATVRLKTGQRVKVTQMHPDGTFDYEPVR
jgi:hypothetical protein